MPEALKRRRQTGLGLYVAGQVFGGCLLLLLFLVPNIFGGQLGTMCIAAALAIPAGVTYLTVPRLLDRYDPEPFYALAGSFFWGAIAACGFSAAINSSVGCCGTLATSPEAGEVMTAVISAPLVEEFFKGMCVWGVAYFLRNEFDGVVDGIIYATFVAIGFAMTENVIYYQRGAEAGQLGTMFLMRGLLFPWGHPVYTAMTGIGFGIARETKTPWLRWGAPLIGYFCAVFLHALWNGSATIAESYGEEGQTMFLCMLPVWFLFVFAFIVMIVVLVRRRGRIIREYLRDEVALRHLTQAEVDLVVSPFGLLRARTTYGKDGAAFVRAAARLALSKWHTHRAAQNSKHTYSMDYIQPLRSQLRTLRDSLRQKSQGRPS